MRSIIIIAMSLAVLAPGGARAQDWTPSLDSQREARWDACYKETRLIYRTRNMSQEQFRVTIKDARRKHMRICMTRATPPRPIASVEIAANKRPSIIAGWAANP
ncbi:hypothetical protein GR328_16295 [Microvirga makkahensis]|uniref:Uncharacterized protein n=2 Tax=Microvirga makkahensis TaxID=1128670 RepID=A0A7X3MTL0_9HYPH|nr:hypothetical protein [Microvirga makkahensis]